MILIKRPKCPRCKRVMHNIKTAKLGRYVETIGYICPECNGYKILRGKYNENQPYQIRDKLFRGINEVK